MTLDDVIAASVWDLLRLADQELAEQMVLNRIVAWINQNG
jgi:hypothetical protein